MKRAPLAASQAHVESPIFCAGAAGVFSCRPPSGPASPVPTLWCPGVKFDVPHAVLRRGARCRASLLPFRFVAPRLASLLTCLLLHRSATIPVHIRQSPFQRLPRLVMPRVCVSAHLPPRAPWCGRLRGSGRIGAPTPLCRGAVAHLPALRLDGCFQRLPRIVAPTSCSRRSADAHSGSYSDGRFQRLPR